MNLETSDELMAARLVSEQDEIIMVSENGRAIRFAVANLRTASRTSGGVRGMRLVNENRVVGVDLCYPDSYLLVLTSNGFGKMSPVRLYQMHRRGGYGVATLRVKEHTGNIVAARTVILDQELLIMSEEGIVIRTPVNKVPKKSRNTLGVYLMRLDQGDHVVSMAVLRQGDGSDEDIETS